MKTKLAAIVLAIFTVFFVDGRINYACPPPDEYPVAVLTAPEHEVTNEQITFDGTGSSPPSGYQIVKYEWDFDCDPAQGFKPHQPSTQNCDSPPYDCPGDANHKYPTAGTYIVALRVTANNPLALTDIDTCTVQVHPASNQVLRVDENSVCNTNCDGSDWNKAYKYLQDALDEAVYSDEIWVAEGTYYPDESSVDTNGTDDPNATFQLKLGVDVYGGFPPNGNTGLNNWNMSHRKPKVYKTILSGDLNGDDGPGFANRDDNSYHVVEGNDMAALDGFTITGGNGGSGAGIYCWDVSPTISNCVIIDNKAAHYGGGMYNGYCNPGAVLTNCFFIGNAGSGGGMYNRHSNPILTNGVFLGNKAPSGHHIAGRGGGIRNDDSSPALVNCTFSKNMAGYAGGGIDNEGYPMPTVTNCIFWDNRCHDSATGECVIDESAQINGSATINHSCIQDFNSFGGIGNIGGDPNFVNAVLPAGWDGIFGTWDDGLRLRAGSLCVDAGDDTTVPDDTADIDGDGNTLEQLPCDVIFRQRIVSSEVDMGAYELPLVWYVDDDRDGNGTSWADAFVSIEAALTASSAGDEIFVAGGTYTPSGVLTINNAVVIRGGYGGFGETHPDKQDFTAYESTIDGGGAYHVVKFMAGSDGAKLEGCTITGGNANGSSGDDCGAGIYFDGVSPAIGQCVITDNTAVGNGGGIYCTNNASPIISNCTIVDNEVPDGSGGGICSVGASPVLNECTITANYAYVNGGGVCAKSGSSVALTNCVIAGNRAVADGGGVYDNDSDSTLVNCTVTANAGGGLRSVDDSNTTIRNCLFWENRIDTDANKIEIKLLGTSHADISNCDVEGGEAGINKGSQATLTFGMGATWAEGGNIDSDPNFVTPGYWEEATAPGTLTLEATVRDFVVAGEEQNYPGFSAHQDFELDSYENGLDLGIVGLTLVGDKPVYTGPGTKVTTSTEENFNQWYHDAPTVNKKSTINIDLSDGDEDGVYEFSDLFFFPIDDGETFEGDTFGNTVINGQNKLGDDSQWHNFHFTLELHHKFKYAGGETFSFRGDDDLFVFIDNQLEIDLGGVHDTESNSVSLDDLDLMVGKIYDFDLFFAERHTTGSVFEIDTSIMPEPIYVAGDYHLESGSACIDVGGNAVVANRAAKDADDLARIVDGDWDEAADVDMGAYEYKEVFVSAGANDTIFLPDTDYELDGTVTGCSLANLRTHWSMVSGPNLGEAYINNYWEIDTTAEFTPSVEGVYELKLEAYEGCQLIGEDTVQITVYLPYIDAGYHQTIELPQQDVNLYGASVDINNSGVTVVWEAVDWPDGVCLQDINFASCTPALPCACEDVVTTGSTRHNGHTCSGDGATSDR